METKIFFSWQSDIRAAACRSLIEGALIGAASEIGLDRTLRVEPVVDRDTSNVPGCPDIGATIFRKIDEAAAFVADVTIVNGGTPGRPMPNPNVLIELGYALKALGDTRIILVQNLAFGGLDLLPFDLRQKRITQFHSPSDAEERASERRALQGTLKTALTSIFSLGPAKTTSPVTVSLNYERLQTSQELHRYRLVMMVRNTSRRRIDDWQAEVEFPTPLVEPGPPVGLVVPERSDQRRTTFRWVAKTPLFPDDERRLTLDYRVDEYTYDQRQDVFAESFRSRVLVDSEVVLELEKPVQDMQCF